jgi:hypothetical protein
MQPFDLRAATTADALAIAELANHYTYQQLSAAERQDGFLTGSFSGPALQAMLASVPGQVAYRGPELVGFVVNSRLAPDRYPPLVQEICALLPGLQYRQRALAAYQWFFYGPVLVKQAYRGHGLLRQLFEASQRELAGHFDLGIAFIAEENLTSLLVHTQKLGLEIVGNITFQGTAYAILVFLVGT